MGFLDSPRRCSGSLEMTSIYMQKGCYIAFEGVVGTGKTTQSKQLEAYLRHRFPDRDVVWTREPGGSEIAEAIRALVQGTTFQEAMHPACDAYLYAAARAQSLRAVVEPVLARGGIVIADRSVLTSVAWQGFGQGLGFDTVWRINEPAVRDLLPDVVLCLDLDVAEGMRRTFDAAGDKFEKLPPEFFARCRDGYAFLAAHDTFRDRWRTVDASGTREAVFARILQSGVVETVAQTPCTISPIMLA